MLVSSSGETIDTKAEFRKVFADRTIRTFDRQHGTQIEYFRPDGRAFLWYPGNRSAVPSNWRIEAFEPYNGVYSLCFQYPSSSYNPVTRRSGGRWECHPAVRYILDTVEIVDGDPFALSTGRVPYPVPKRQNLSLSQAANRQGISVSKLDLKNEYTTATRLLTDEEIRAFETWSDKLWADRIAAIAQR